MPKTRKLWTWDIEAVDWDKPLCVCAVCEDGREITFWGEDCLDRIMHVMQQEGGSWLAHYSGGYDTPLLMERTGWRPKNIILTGTLILCAEDGHLKLRDTYPATLASLEKLGKWVGVEKQTETVDRANLGDADPKLVIEYCLQDCRALLAAVKGFHAFLEDNGAKKAWTAGAAAVNLLRALEPHTWRQLLENRCDWELARLVFPVIRGGRVECWARGEYQNVYSYDFKSSYPARYAYDSVGVGLRPWEPDEPPKNGIFNVRWYWPDRDRIPPVLDDATQAGAGYCKAWMISEELEALQESGGQKIEVLEGWRGLRKINLGHIFAETLFAQKERGVPWAKVYVNSLHGKLGEDPLKEQITFEHPNRYWAPLGKPKPMGDFWLSHKMTIGEDLQCAPHCQPIASAQILGRARVALFRVFRAIEDLGFPVLYCDTDSVHTLCPPKVLEKELKRRHSDDVNHPTFGTELGELAYESGPCTGYYLGPKSYLLVNQNGEPEKSALKGVPLKNLKNGVRSETAPTGRIVYKQAPAGTKGKDLRTELFREAVQYQWGVSVEKEGLRSFRAGVRMKQDRWTKQRLLRTVKSTGRGKTFAMPFGPNDPEVSWRYLTPTECADPPMPDGDFERDEYGQVIFDF